LFIQIVGDVHYGNYIPPKNRADYESFNDLMWERHDEKLHLRNSSKKSETDKMKHVAHLKKNYLSPDPCCSGGRAVGIEGQPGSNQGGEKRGGQIKLYHRVITRRLSKEAKKSVVFILAAVAMDLELDSNLTEFAVEPVRSLQDYSFLRKLSEFDLEDSKCNLMLDAKYMLCTELGNHQNIIDRQDVIGKESASFTAHFPTASLVYSNVSVMENEKNNNSSKSFLEQPTAQSEVADTAHKCSKILDKMSDDESRGLLQLLRKNLVENIPGRKPGENLIRFVQRRAQRNPSFNTTTRTVERVKAKRKKGLSKEEKEREKLKWGEFSPELEEGEDEDKTNSVDANPTTTDNSSGGGEDNNDVFLYWTDEFDWCDILKFLESNNVDVETDTTLKSIEEASNRVRLKRQLGDWIEVDVDANSKRVKCNCEDYNTDRTCYHQATLEVLQFKKYPIIKHQKGQEQWPKLRTKCLAVLNKTCIKV